MCAHAASEAAQARAGLVVHPAEDMTALRELVDLLDRVWGRNDEGVPISSEMMRSLAHADGLVSIARDRDSGALVGGAVLGRAGPGQAYSYIAAAQPTATNRGVGFALKQHQRAWCLERDVTLMRWTFDPLVARNALFNLGKLGATAASYERAFYGQMSDAINGDDPADRFVATWRMDSPRVDALAEGADLAEPTGPPLPGAAEVQQTAAGPDGELALVRTTAETWVRVPGDIVTLRRDDPALASAWRQRTRTWFTTELRSGRVADLATRTGWYRLRPPEPTAAEDPS